MMMTSGGAVHYKSMVDAGSQIIAKEGVKSLFKGAGANILRGVAGAGVLSLYDKLQELMFGKVYSVSVRLERNEGSKLYLDWLLMSRVDPDKRFAFRTCFNPTSFSFFTPNAYRSFIHYIEHSGRVEHTFGHRSTSRSHMSEVERIPFSV